MQCLTGTARRAAWGLGSRCGPVAAAPRRSLAFAASASRLGRSTTDSGSGGSAVYETGRAVDEYLQFHYAPARDLLPYSPEVAPTAALDFPRRCAELALSARGRGRALDVGCSVGGMSFELARHFQAVLGVDFSHAFVAAAADMRARGARSYTTLVEGSNTEERQAAVDPAIDRSRCAFEQGDACALRADLGTFDAVLAANLLCRLPEPKAFLARCASLLNPGGVLVLVSPYSWLEEYTPRDRWLGGHSGVSSSPTVAAILESHGLKRVDRRDMPFLIREHARKFQWGCSEASVWTQQ